MNHIIPLILFVYNRPDHTKRIVSLLKKNRNANKTVLYVFSDGPQDSIDNEKVCKVRQIIDDIDGFCSVRLFANEENLGLRRSIISGVSEVLKKYKAVIVLEDDIISAPGFLSYMNESLDKYSCNKNVWSVAAYSSDLMVPDRYLYDNFAAPCFSCWGWGTWRDRWEQVDWEYDRYDDVFADENAPRRFARGGEDRKYVLDLMRSGRVESWAAVFDFFHFLNDAVCMHPVKPLVRNIGLDGSGTNCGVGAETTELFSGVSEFNLIDDVSEHEEVMASFRQNKRLSWKSRVKRMMRTVGVLK